MNGTQYIPIPWRYRWRRFRYGTLPWMGFFAFAALLLWVWSRQGVMPNALGEVEAVRVSVAAAVSGKLVPLPQGPWSLYEKVEADQVMAQIDDQPLQAQLKSSTQELERLTQELKAAGDKLKVSEADRARSQWMDSVRMVTELEQYWLIVLTRQVQIETDRLELQRRNTRVDCMKLLYDKKMISELEMNTERMLRDEVAKRVGENQKALAEAVRHQKEAEKRLAALPKLQVADVQAQLEPVRVAAKVQAARIEEVKVQIDRLPIRAPIRGMICAINHWPGENVQAGEPILTLAPEQGRYIVSYLRQEQRIEPRVGMPVEVRLRVPMSRAVISTVQYIGPQVEPIPSHQCRDPRIPEWGLPVRIFLPKDFAAHPGELLNVTFKPASKGDG
jgi:multidrug resistance efflux pump